MIHKIVKGGGVGVLEGLLIGIILAGLQMLGMLLSAKSG